MSRVKIKVKKSHIQLGRKDDAASCPVARAIKEYATDNGYFDRVRVYGCDAYVNGHYRKMSRSVERFVNRFDKGKKVKPFTFLMEKV